MEIKLRKKSIIGTLLIFISIFVISMLAVINKMEQVKLPSLDISTVNDLVESVKKNWDSLDKCMVTLRKKYTLDFIILDSQGNEKYRTKNNLSKDINTAISHRDTIVDIYDENNLLGRLIIYNDYNSELSKHKKVIIIVWLAVGFINIVFLVCLLIYLYIRVYRPFYQLQDFARNVAAGNLDLPLHMDRKNIFGAFTESFDLMREELKSAREAERKANTSKKELVAQLSHDIKTPVASIKAVSELLEAKSANNKDIYHLQTIGEKADQINTLITNMFNATLEELQELKVEVSEQKSSVIWKIISYADYLKKVKKITKKDCLIYADKNRLMQVIDNIISNSYKYADSDIEITANCTDEYLLIEFRDFGEGVKEIELPFLLHKFYRAKNSEGKAGAGLGLYTSCYLMKKMQGDLICENIEDGFQVTIMLRLV